MKIYSLFLLTTFFVAALYAKNPIVFHLQKIICTVHDPLAVTIEICSLKAINRSTTLINVAGNYTRPIKTLLINSQLYKKSEIKYSPFLVNVTDNFCEFFSKNKAGAYFRIVWPIISPYTNMNHGCPYIGYHYYKNLPVDVEKIPPVWPNGNFLLDVLLHEANNNKLLTTQVYFELKKRPGF